MFNMNTITSECVKTPNFVVKTLLQVFKYSGHRINYVSCVEYSAICVKHK